MVKAENRGGPYAWYTIAVLGFAYTLSVMDRLAPSLLIGPIRQDLHIGDVQVSLLTGFAFVAFYATAGVPISALADRWSRKAVILIGVALWGLTTAACGLSTTFWQFFLARTGVGLGEAALTPSALAMASELFTPAQRSRASGVFVLGAAAGVGLSLIVGGALIAAFTRAAPLSLPGFGVVPVWGWVLMSIGAMTLCALIPLATIANPPRAAMREASSFKAALAALWRSRRGYAPLFLGAPLVSLASYGLQTWAPSLFIRKFHWTATKAGLEIGLTALIVGAIGILGGAWLSDWSRRRGRLEAPLTVMTWSFLAAAPFFVLLALSDNATMSLVFFALASLIGAPLSALAPSALQAITPDGVRGQVTAVMLLVINLVGLGLGPTVVALVGETVFKGPGALASAIGLVGAVAMTISGVVMALGRKAYRRDVEAIESVSG